MLRLIYNNCRGYLRWYRIRKGYQKLYRLVGKKNPTLLLPIKGEKEWLDKWRVIDRNTLVYSYRIFSRYVGNDLNIVPLEICAKKIEPVLNPFKFYAFYEDKNTFDKLFPKGFLPQTLLRNINGLFYDANYHFVDGKILDRIPYQKIIVKPTVGGESGKNVQVFNREGKIWKNKLGDKLSIEYLISTYGKDFIVQEYLYQNCALGVFNPTSVNTIRIVTYRSIINDEVAVVNAILRVGAAGKDVDNAHSGGMFCGVFPNGELGKYMCNYLGEKTEIFNGIDYSKNTFVIPYYDKVISFAKDVASQIIHCRLLALDIMIDVNGNPRLIEFNIGGFSAWLFQFTTGSAFGKYTDEILDYCCRDVRFKI